MKTLRKAGVIALAVELVCGGVLYLGESDYLTPLHLDLLAIVAMLLHLGAVLLTSGSWLDRLPRVGYAATLFLAQWLLWKVLLYLLLLVREYWRRRKTATWKKATAVALISCGAILLVSKWEWPPTPHVAARPPRAPKGVTVRSVTTNALIGDFFYRPSDKPQKAVILLGGSEGGKSWSDCTGFIQELVDQGFCVLSLAYFGTEGLPTQLQSIPLEYFSKAFDWLARQRDAVVPGHYALVGASKGAELALLLGSRYPEVKAVVAIAPSSVVFQGSPRSKLDALRGQHSSWSLNGREFPFVPAPYSPATLRGMLMGRYTRMFEEEFRNTARLNAAAIPVENSQCPILLVSFTRDEIWPSTPMSEQIMARLSERGFRFHYEHVAYDAGHCHWSIKPCRVKILTFLTEQFLTGRQPRLSPSPFPGT